MDVNCTRCGAEYEFEETLVSNRGTTVKCTNCGHLFKVFRPGSFSGIDETKPWLIRKTDGSVEPLVSLNDLARLITLGSFHPDDEISRAGKVWKRLGDIAELHNYFAAFRASVQLAHTRGQTPASGVEVATVHPESEPRLRDEGGKPAPERARRESPPRFTASQVAPPAEAARQANADRVRAATIGNFENLPPRQPTVTQIQGSEISAPMRKQHKTPDLPAIQELDYSSDKSEQLATPDDLTSDDDDSVRDSDSRETKVHQRSDLGFALTEPDGRKNTPSMGDKAPRLKGSTPQVAVSEKYPAPPIPANEALRTGREKPFRSRQKLVWLSCGALLMGLIWVTWGEIQGTETVRALEDVISLYSGKKLQSLRGHPSPKKATSPSPPRSTSDIDGVTKSKPKSALLSKQAPIVTPPLEDGYDHSVKKGDLLYWLENYQGAEKAYREALSIRPDAPQALVGMGYVQLETGHVAEAIAYFQKAAPQGEAQAYVGLGDAYLRLHQNEDALLAYENYVKADPDGGLLSIAREYIEKLQKQIPAKQGI